MLQPIILYPGRFQPFSLHHYKVYKWAEGKFNLPIHLISSNKTELPKSPLNFADKQYIINSLYNIQDITQVFKTYNAIELMQPNFAAVYLVGEKDGDRLANSKFFLEWDGISKLEYDYTQHGYYYIVPNVKIMIGKNQLSGTLIRHIFTTNKISLTNKKKYFQKMFGTYNESIFNFLTTKFS